MSELHKRYLPIIARHVDRMGYTWTHPEAHLSLTGERADLWAVAERPIEAMIETRDGRTIDLTPGLTSVHEFKASVADLRVDREKLWRKPGVRALGELRYYWVRDGGEVRPEHIDEGWGWGVVVFDDHRFDVVRPSAWFPCAFRDSILLARQLERRAAVRQVRELVQRQREARALREIPSPHRPSDHLPDAGKKVAGGGGDSFRGLPEHVALVRDYIANHGPANTASLCRCLLDDHGIKITPAKLMLAMKKVRIFVQDGAGGNWSLKQHFTQ